MRASRKGGWLEVGKGGERARADQDGELILPLSLHPRWTGHHGKAGQQQQQAGRQEARLSGRPSPRKGCLHRPRSVPLSSSLARSTQADDRAPSAAQRIKRTLIHKAKVKKAYAKTLKQEGYEPPHAAAGGGSKAKAKGKGRARDDDGDDGEPVEDEAEKEAERERLRRRLYGCLLYTSPSPRDS